MSQGKYIPSTAVKSAFLISSLVMLFGVIYYQVDKRIRFAELLVENALAPLPADIETKGLFFSDDKGKHFELSTLKGKWTLLHFWATWCPPCRTEMPSLFALSTHLASKISVVAVSVDDDYSAVDKFFLGQEVPFALAWDKKKVLAEKLNIEKFPESFLINPEGKIVSRFSGPRNWSSTEALSYFSRLLSAS